MNRKNCQNQKTQYKKYLEFGLILSLLLHIFLLQAYKRCNINAVQRHVNLPHVDTFDIPAVKTAGKRIPPARPSVPLPSTEEYLTEDETIDPDEWVLEDKYNPLPPEPLDDTTIPPFEIYDQPPKPIGGYQAILDQVVYPELAKMAGIEGKVVLDAQIDENGDVIATRVVKSLGPTGCDEAAARAIRAVKWNPAYQRDMPVKVWITITVEFKLTKQ